MEYLELKQPKFIVVESDPVRKGLPGKLAPAPLSKSELENQKIIHPGMKDTDILNAFRDLRTSIMPKLHSFNSVLMVCAARKGGGASFNALNLAVSCTFDQHRHALLVDCNFDRPSLAERLHVAAETGLYDYLTGGVDEIREVIYPTGIPRLSLVPTGNVSSREHLEFFTGERMRSFLQDIKNRYDDRIIILDSPPVLDSADAKILGEVTEYVLMVLPYKTVSSGKVDKMLKAVVRDKIVGFVINN